MAFFLFGYIHNGRAQGSFRVIGGIPHLPVTVAANMAPEAGMIVFDVAAGKPLVYSGSAWESLCATNLIGAQPASSFKTVDGIPSLPVLSSDPSGPSPAGAVYYSTSRQRIMVFSGTAWRTLTDLRSASGALPITTGFGTSASLQISRIPVLAADPFPIGLSDGAFYLSSVARRIRYYANGSWQDLNCSPIETLEPSGVTNSSFTSGIRILSSGGSFSEVGICWSKTLDPLNTLPTSLAYSGAIPSDGELPLTVTNNLDANTTYYVRAYAVVQGSGEVIYGENKPFTTDVASKATIVTLPEDPLRRMPISAVAGGDITRDGGARVSSRGVIYSETNDPAIDPLAVETFDGSGVGSFPSKMSPLKANTKYYARAFADNIKGRAFGLPIVEFTTPGPTAPVLSPSITISNITDVSASTKVTILNNGGAEVRERGVSWSKIPIPASDWRLDHPDIDHERSQTVSAFDIGTFDCQLLRLLPGERYYVRTYAWNDIDISFSSETAFDATGLPTINTLPLDEQATTGRTALGAGEVISTGASALIERGFIFSKVPNFDPATERDTLKTVLPSDPNTSGTGLFYGLRQELEPGTTYYFCAYAKNSFGIKYGDVLEFPTAAKPTVVTDPMLSAVSATSATGGGNVTDDGGEPVFYRGLCWNQDPLNPEPNEYVLGGNGTGPFFSTINGLRANTTYYVRAFGTNSVGAGYGEPVQLITGSPVSATIQTYPINNTSGTSVSAGGNILNDGGSDVRERGFCWNTTGAPTINDSKISGGTGSGTFDLMIAGLQSEKTYYVRAYALTDAPLPSYGNVVSFKTIARPTVFTKTDVTVTGTTASVSGDIISDGGSQVSRSGIVWDLSDEPTINLATRVQSGKGMGQFDHTIGELLGNSTYFYRAYATNEVGTAYGDSRTLRTPPPVKPTVKTMQVKNITGISGRGGGEIISHGGALLVETGLVWSTNRNFIPEDVVNERTRQTDPWSFTSVMTGLMPGVTYYVRAYAKNGAGLVAYGDPVEFTTWNYATVETLPVLSHTNVSAIGQGRVLNNGGTAVTRNGLVWAEHEEPTVEDFVSTPPGSGTGTFTANLTSLYGNTTYYVRAFAVNSAGVAYGPEKVFFKTDSPVAPTLETKRPESTALTTAVGGGTIVNHGGGRVTSRGIVWGSSAGFDYRNPEGKFEQTGYGEGAFSMAMTGLIPGRKYYVRAFADNGTFRGYGPELEFTQADLPGLTTRPASARTNKTITTGGVVTSTGFAPLLRTGMVWSTDPSFDPKAEQVNRIEQHDAASFATTITGLKGGIDYYVSAFAVNVAGISFGQKEKVQTLAAGYAEVITTAAADVTGTTARTGGNITDDGGSYITTRGVAYTENKDLEPQKIPLANKVMQSGSATGPFVTYLSGLKENTIYYIRAFAVNGVDTTYGDQKQFRTQGRPIVTIDRASAPFATRAGTAVVIDARIVDDGRARMLGHGIVWSTSSGPTIDLSTRVSYNLGGIGGYQAVIDGLQPATEYFVRGYGINTVGLNYGNVEFHFETPPISPPVLSVLSVTPIGESEAAAVADITDNGGSWVSERGFIWSMDPDFDPRNADEDHKIRLGEDIGRIQGLFSDLKPGETYYVWAYAVNKADVTFSTPFLYAHPAVLPKVITDPLVTTLSTTSARGAGTIADSGGSSVLATGLVWSTKFNFDPNTDPVSSTSDGDLSGGFNSTMTGLSERVTYYVRAYATNGKGTGYGEQVSFCLFATAPELTTISVQDILGQSANVSGSLDRDGGMPATRWGFVWSTDKEPDYYKHPHTEIVRGGSDPVFTGDFNGGLSGLLPNTQYYVRAYAINLAGVGYGVPVAFLTADYPTLTAASVDQLGTTVTSISGSITHNGRLPILKRGIVWGRYDNPEVNPLGRVEEDVAPGPVQGHGEGEFILKMTGLLPETSYFAKAYGVNQVGTTYSAYVKVRTKPITEPSVQTVEPINITPTSADPGGDVTDNGGADITRQGILYSTSGFPELTIDNGIFTVNNGAAQFTANLADLEPGTTYYYRAYAYNGYKYGYGDQKSFPTPAVPPTLGEVTITEIQSTSVKATAEMTHTGGDPVTARGFVWTTQASDPTVISNEGYTDDMRGVKETFTHTLTPLQEGKVYRVRAYATNGVNTGYGPVEIFTICPPSITRYHAAGHNGAPVDKSVTYEVIGSEASGEVKCWIARNLGADSQATTASDSRPEAAGWYWQFSKQQGYEYGVSRTPATWISGISDPSDWVAANDPCRLLLGEGWRLPTKGEYDIADANWTAFGDPFASELKLHAAGFIEANGATQGVAPGALYGRGQFGNYWSSTRFDSNQGHYFRFNSVENKSFVTNVSKAYGMSVRCIQAEIVKTAPSVSDVVVSEMTPATAKVAAAVTIDGGSAITDRGFVWNDTGAAPVLDTDQTIRPGPGGNVGPFESTLTGLEAYKVYHVWAFAKNQNNGITFSPVATFKLCPPVTRQHVAGVNGAPVSRQVDYEVVSAAVSGQPACWLGRNLGAEKQGQDAFDGSAEAAGWYWQFGVGQGFEYKASRVPATTWTSPSASASNWPESTDPCNLLLGGGWRLPTQSEYVSANTNWKKLQDGYNSPLKLHAAGFIDRVSGVIGNRGRAAAIWTSDSDPGNSANGWHLGINNLNGDVSTVASASKAYGLSVRCILIDPVITAPIVSSIAISDMAATQFRGKASVLYDGGKAITEHGLVWSTTPDPTVDNKMGSVYEMTNVVGDYSMDVTGLRPGQYYVRAYASNGIKIGYGPVEKVLICPESIARYHIEGQNGAPESKQVTYGVTSIVNSGKNTCWITQNLGASKQAASATDPDPAAAGWYWQYNRPGTAYYFSGATRVPSAGWVASINEGSEWSGSDPCALLIGAGWRMPTKIEWEATESQWNTLQNAFDSPLKIHAAGWVNSTGLKERGETAAIWSSNQGSGSLGWSYWSSVAAQWGSVSDLRHRSKPDAESLRCLAQSMVSGPPFVTYATIDQLSATEVKASAIVVSDGFDNVTDWGFVWNETGAAPVLDQDRTVRSALGTGIGTFSATLNGLEGNKVYYVWAFAKNEHSGVTLSPVSSFTVCPPITRIHMAGVNGAPVEKTVTYKTVSSTLAGTGPKCWIAQNLGADEAPGTATDTSPGATGWYWQFNRLQGFSFGSGTVTPLSWTNPNENTSWSGSNDPCTMLLGGGWRIPTSTEWGAVKAKISTLSAGFSSELKLHAGGGADGTNTPTVPGLVARGTEGYYWTSTNVWNDGVAAYFFKLTSGQTYLPSWRKSSYYAVRCIRDNTAALIPQLGSTLLVNSTSTSAELKSATLVDDRNEITERGFTWTSSDRNPNRQTDSYQAVTGTGLGYFSAAISPLAEGVVYSVSSYAVLGNGTIVYGPAEKFTVCLPVTVAHVAGVNGSPITKTITYQTTSSTVAGTTPKCWITQNLGAERPATSAADASEQAAGWYYQYNRKQAFEFLGTAPRGISGWLGPAGNAFWSSAEDPCRLLLGAQWRIPTQAEWRAVAAKNPSFEIGYQSPLKLHAAGTIENKPEGQSLVGRGVAGIWWSNSPYSAYGAYWFKLSSVPAVSVVDQFQQEEGHSVRCIKDIN